MSQSTCLAHPDRPAVATCASCGLETCAACEVRARGTSWCEACFGHALSGHGGAAAPGAASGVEPGPPPPGAAAGASATPAARLKSPAAATLLALLVPGLGTIYCFEGPVRRGLVQFGGWAVLLWCMTRADDLLSAIFGIAWLGWWLWQALDAHATARMINALGRIPSEEEAVGMGRGPWPFRGEHSEGMGLALVVIGGVLLLFEAGGALFSAGRFLIPVALAGAGAWILWRSRAGASEPAPSHVEADGSSAA